VSAYWQALLSALEGNAKDCAAAIVAVDIIEKSSRCFLTPDMARRSSHPFAATFCIALFFRCCFFCRAEIVTSELSTSMVGQKRA
jgi:hypothetical protein